MALSIVRRLSLGELTSTIMSIQMVDTLMAKLEGILEDVLVEVGKFIFPIDFVVIDIEEDKHIPILIGKPFLAIGAALIDVKKRELTNKFGEEEVYFNLKQSLRQHDVEQSQCMKINSVIPDCKEKNDDLMKDNSFSYYFSTLLYNYDFEKENILA